MKEILDQIPDKPLHQEWEGLLIIDNTLCAVSTTQINLAAEKSCYVYAIGTNSFVLRGYNGNVVSSSGLQSASPRNTDYKFGVKNKNNDLYWRVSSEGNRKGALINRDNPYLSSLIREARKVSDYEL